MEKSYKRMKIGDGGTASAEFFNMTYGNRTEEENQI